MAERRRKVSRPGVALLAAVAIAALAGGALWPRSPDLTLEPAVAALAAPGSRFETLTLANGAVLAAESIEHRDGEWLLRAGGRERVVDPERVAARPIGSVRFWLGSDRFGRDVAARLLHGARVSLLVALGAVAVALGVGVPLGIAAGFARGGAARALLALVEGAQAFPRLFLVVALAAVVTPSVASTIAILGLSGWMPIARLVRAETRKLVASDFVLAVRGLGASPWWIASRHVLPGVVAPIVVEASLGMAGAIAGEAALSFLGLGAPPPTASWGNLIAEGRDLVAVAPWISIVPGVALALTVLACNLVAESGRERADPRRPMLST